MATCTQTGCSAAAIGWRGLRDGGSTQVGTCEQHTAAALIKRLVPVAVTAAKLVAKPAPAKK